MKVDSYGFLEMEHTSFPGSIGDSCAETFRHLTLERFLNPIFDFPIETVYQKIKTEKGYLRHPTSPWKEDDFSGDQATPLFIALELFARFDLSKEVKTRFKWKYGNGDLIQPTFKAAVERKSLFWDFFIYGQAMSMKHLPYRWDDGTKSIEKSKDSSCDFINFIHLILHAEFLGHTYFSRKAKEVFSADFVMKKVVQYYAPEPNCDFLLDLYEKSVYKVFSMHNPQIGPLFNVKPLLL